MELKAAHKRDGARRSLTKFNRRSKDNSALHMPQQCFDPFLMKFDIVSLFPYHRTMGKIFTGDGWILKVQGDEHPPVHVHLLHPDGKASIALNGAVQNTGVPDRVIAIASVWISLNAEIIGAEWAKMNNPKKR